MRPRLVATLGPASLGLAPAIVQAGAHSLRLNASHMDPAALTQALESIRSALPRTPVVVDLQGAKMRLGSFEPRAVSPAERVRFSLRPQPGTIPLPHPELFRFSRAGETLSVDDDRMRFELLQVDHAACLAEAVCVRDGVLRPRKGANIVAHPVALDDLVERDQQHVAQAARFAHVSFAVSFMTDGHEAAWVRHRAPACPVIGKVERQEALAQLALLQANVDEVWICRGDLGSQLGAPALARWLHGFRPASRPPVLLAGQVLEHLTAHPSPTRSEVCHLFDVLERGYAGIVLSDETAIGCDPVGAVRTAAGLLHGLAAP